MTKKIIFLLRFFLACWVSGLFYLSLIPAPSKKYVVYRTMGSVGMHFLAFFVLLLLIYFSFYLYKNNVLKYSFISLLYCLMISLAKEGLQVLVAWRIFSVIDLLIDFFSAALAVILLLMFVPRSLLEAQR